MQPAALNADAFTRIGPDDVAARRAMPIVRERLIRDVPGDLASEWAQLAGRPSEPNPFEEPWFVAASLTHLRGGPIRLLEVRSGHRLIGLLMAGVERGYGRTSIRNVQNCRHHHHFLGTPLVAPDQEVPFWEAVLAHLDRAAWAPNFLHLTGLAEHGPVLRGLRETGRSCPVVFREIRAFLNSDLAPVAYYERVVRKKKRKELARLRNRLEELGEVRFRLLAEDDDLSTWCDAFLALERSGWKGREGSALASQPETEAFFRAAVAGAHAAGRLQFLRLDHDGRAIAMLVNFIVPPGSFSFKTAFDEAYARFSPGVLIQLENLRILDDPAVAWMDSCASAHHPMIDGLWAERRSIVRVTVPLHGLRRRLVHFVARTLEEAAAARRRIGPGGAR